MPGLVEKAFIIRRLRVPSSMEYAQTCADSCVINDLPYEFVDGIEFMTSEDAFAAVGVTKNPDFKSTQGHDNCHASHIKTWRRIIELGVTGLILEHDAIVKGNVQNIEIPDQSVVTFGYRVQQLKFYEPQGPITELVEIPKSIGCHAYAITPSTAQWLITEAETKGIGYNLDKYLMMERSSGLPLYAVNPPQIVAWPRVGTREWQNPEKQWGEAPATWNYAESIVSGWEAGWDTDRV